MDSERKFISKVLREDAAAVAFIETLFALVHTWDDLIDGDAVIPDRIHQAFTDALVTLPRNPFWQRHAVELQPLIEAALIDWKVANRFESGSDNERVLAYGLREHFMQILIRAAWCLGGQEWAERVAPEVWRANQDDTLEDYLEELANR